MSASKKLVVFGTEATAKMAHWYFTKDSDHEVVAFTVDGAYLKADRYLGLPVVPFEDLARTHPPDDFEVFVAVGYGQMNKVRQAKYEAARAMGYRLPSYISSRCSFLTEEPHGDNLFVMEDNTIQPFVRLGSNIVLWSGNHVGHEAEIGDHCFITSHVVISGYVKVGNNCFFGVNATIRDAVTIAPETLVAAGAIVMKDTEPKGVYLPARTVKHDKTSDQIVISG
jgi:sugar O-acyltransferase (sialic acid O-acetyltransferase NeuD family)